MNLRDHIDPGAYLAYRCWRLGRYRRRVKRVRIFVVQQFTWVTLTKAAPGYADHNASASLYPGAVIKRLWNGDYRVVSTPAPALGAIARVGSHFTLDPERDRARPEEMSQLWVSRKPRK